MMVQTNHNSDDLKDLELKQERAKDSYIQIRINSELKEFIKQQAGANSLTSYIMDAIFEKLENDTTLSEITEKEFEFSEPAEKLRDTENSESIEKESKPMFDFFLIEEEEDKGVG